MKLAEIPGSSLAFSEYQVQHLQTDARLDVQPQTLFIAMKGVRYNSHQDVQRLLEENPSLLACGEEMLSHSRYFQVQDSRSFYAWGESLLHGVPSKKMQMYGITGTSGKTTTAWILEHLLKSSGRSMGLIGTLLIRDQQFALSSEGFTSPPADKLQSVLERFYQDGTTDVVMEVSSHALSQRRVEGTLFDVMGFLNLSEEHLDFHKDMEEYFEAKKRLFFEHAQAARLQGKQPVAVVNVDSVWGTRLADELVAQGETRVERVGMSLKEGESFVVRVNTQTEEGVTFQMGGKTYVSPLLGTFNIQNATLALAMATIAGERPSDLAKYLRTLSSVPGRLERVVGTEKSPTVWVDYAHKPEALEKVLSLLREEQKRTGKNGALICVVGCGGDRDRLKRPKMARIAEALADHVYLTSDNPRSENPVQILNEMQSGLVFPDKAHLISDREEAIRSAICSAHSTDWILIAGKGHETTQEIQGHKYPFDDREVARRHLFGA